MNNKDIVWHLHPVVETQNPMWRKYANCRDVPKDVFIMRKGQTPKRALWFCETCVVKKACFEYALDNNCIGVWGGTTQKQRARIKRQQKIKKETK